MLRRLSHQRLHEAVRAPARFRGRSGLYRSARWPVEPPAAAGALVSDRVLASPHATPCGGPSSAPSPSGGCAADSSARPWSLTSTARPASDRRRRSATVVALARRSGTPLRPRWTPDGPFASEPASSTSRRERARRPPAPRSKARRTVARRPLRGGCVSCRQRAIRDRSRKASVGFDHPRSQHLATTRRD